MKVDTTIRLQAETETEAEEKEMGGELQVAEAADRKDISEWREDSTCLSRERPTITSESVSISTRSAPSS